MHASTALVNKMKTAEKLDLEDKLLPIYNKVIERLEKSDNNKFIGPVDHAFKSKTNLLLQNGQDEEALDALDGAIKRFDKPGKNSETLSRFMFKKAELLEDLNRAEEALSAYEQYLERFDKTVNED